MPGKGPEGILRGHKKFLTSEGGARKYFEHEGGGGQNIKFMKLFVTSNMYYQKSNGYIQYTYIH
jgi:hypothetical protein